MILVGITGGVATGKTTVGKLFQEWGAQLVEADGIGWELLRRKEIGDKLVQAFGSEILNSKGEIAREKLGGIVFSSVEAREKLNSIVHPPLLEKLKERIEEVRGSDFKGILAVVAALIPEWGIRDWFDKLVVVTCPEDQAVERLVSHGLRQREARDRIGSQVPEEDKMRGADFVIDNSGDLAELKEQARRVWREITRSRTLSS